MNLKYGLIVALLFMVTWVHADSHVNNKYLCVINPERCNGNGDVIPLVSEPNDVEKFTNFAGMSFIEVPKGEFVMGSLRVIPPNEAMAAETFFRLPGTEIPETIVVDAQADPDESPIHWVSISTAFQMAQYEVTLGQFQEFVRDIGLDVAKEKGMASDEFIKRNNYGLKAPVVYVSWNDVKAYIAWLNNNKPASDKGIYRLPTEAEWEYAARAGSDKHYISSESSDDLKNYAWFDVNSDNKPHDVGEKKPNAWQLYDMQGNVWEWVSDVYGEGYYSPLKQTDPKGAENGQYRVIRGGSWAYQAKYCRAAERNSYPSDYRSRNLGFRLVRVVSPRT